MVRFDAYEPLLHDLDAIVPSIECVDEAQDYATICSCITSKANEVARSRFLFVRLLYTSTQVL